jgi:hypothetical protein
MLVIDHSNARTALTAIAWQRMFKHLWSVIITSIQRDEFFDDNNGWAYSFLAIACDNNVFTAIFLFSKHQSIQGLGNPI